MAIQCLVLGAGQEVGKSCVVVTIGSRRIMFDCGMHMGFNDHRRFPDFKRIPGSEDFTESISCVIVTHFHLDHIGALPYFTEVLGYEGPIYMTYPTKALAPLMLEDYRKVMVDRRGEEEQFNFLQIQNCIKKVTAVDLKQTIQVDSDLHIRAYYAGHVLGAAMFYVKVGDSSVVYTGDYNMTPDRHLGSAQIDRLFPDILITESTYAITIRDSKYAREREFLKAVHTCVAAGGKVLIPVFALGRAQELCILLDDYWERMSIKVPIYFSAGLTIQSNVYYKLLISWTNQNVKDTYASRNKFDFKHVVNFDRSLIKASGPCVLFATPGMISGGLSLDVFKEWAPSEKNLVALPGYCVAGTVGHKLMSGKAKSIKLDKRTEIDVRCQIHVLSFSAHTDAKGIMDLVKQVSPKHTVLVHGEKPKMTVLKARIYTELGIPSYAPANNETIEVPSGHQIKVNVTKEFLKRNVELVQQCNQNVLSNLDYNIHDLESLQEVMVQDRIPVEGNAIVESGQKIKIHFSDSSENVNASPNDIQYVCCYPIYMKSGRNRKSVCNSEDRQETISGPDSTNKRIRTAMAQGDEINIEKDVVETSTEKSLMTTVMKDALSPDVCMLTDFSHDSNYATSRHTMHNNSLLSKSDIDFLHMIYIKLVQHLGALNFEEHQGCIKGMSVCIRICSEGNCFYRSVDFPDRCKLAYILHCSWSRKDYSFAEKIISVLGIIEADEEEI